MHRSKQYLLIDQILGAARWSLIEKDRRAGSVISRVPLSRPLTGALASGRAPPSSARISGQPTGTVSGLAALGDRHADGTAGGGRAVGLKTLVLGIHPATIDEQRIAQGPGAIAVERVDNHTPHPVEGACTRRPTGGFTRNADARHQQAGNCHDKDRAQNIFHQFAPVLTASKPIGEQAANRYYKSRGSKTLTKRAPDARL